MALILAVDDEHSVRTVVRLFLENAGYTVITAECGREGVNLAKKHDPALILMDVTMPGEIDGIQALAEIKNNPKTSHIPVIMLTAVDNSNIIEQAMYDYAEVYITKPCDKTDLLKTVARVLTIRKSG